MAEKPICCGHHQLTCNVNVFNSPRCNVHSRSLAPFAETTNLRLSLYEMPVQTGHKENRATSIYYCSAKDEYTVMPVFHHGRCLERPPSFYSTTTFEYYS
jgi:hypothetical protein